MAAKGADGFVRARSSGKTGAPFSHLPTGGEGGGAIIKLKTNYTYLLIWPTAPSS